ncbi:hypothetical protein AMK21_13315 [Streptomyces sp. CB00316]|uniref:hypothetical protein n=1 Tax=unclassified Streptomyces TaxID=2593676 RepID=UPI00093AD5D1|nr:MULTISPECIES: hypothetical protein [unclassified Streptomyces]MBT2376661.1 hypothetical protein [Streptomyces sp. ISL-111]MBT2424450.1 hypothetical protein [Streptomyces sp. ISL-112]MBT2464985.1 hypothetical protein [Streptomyces sp. ISL-63]OKJ20900.1 hypothetical protein AMK21_13315 [Streptomyces sp. CB00316]
MPYLLIVVLCLPMALVALWIALRWAVLHRRGVAVAGDEPGQRFGATFTVDGERYACRADLGPGSPRGDGDGVGLILYDPRKPRRNDAQYSLRPSRLGGCAFVVVLLLTAIVWAGVRLVGFL